MTRLVWVGTGGFLGAVARYLVAGFFLRFSSYFPLGTLVVNALGSLGLGFLMTLATESLAVPPDLRLLLAVGFFGSFTTFSTFAYETDSLIKGGSLSLAFLNIGISLVLGLLGIRLGDWLARQFFI